MSRRLIPLLALAGFSATAFLNLSALAAKEKDPADKAKKKEADHTSNRGPENPELKFKLPAPPIHTAAEELKTFKVPKGFHVELVASEPMIEAPIAMSWDDQGRLYVLEMRGYMQDVNGKGEDQPLCRVKRLEDTDGDGKMDKATIFVDKLVMPRAVMALGDGALVAEPPNVTFYHDTDGDGVADKSEVIATNYGRAGGQPEHMANSLTWCMDNWIWSAAHSDRYRYQGGKFIAEAMRSAGQWGLTQDDWGRRYFNYNSDFLRADLLPPQMYARNPSLTDRLALNYQVMKDQHCWNATPTPGVNRGYQEGKENKDGTLSEGQLRNDGTLQTCTATCGAVVYRGDLFPKEFRGNAFIPEPSGNLVKRVTLSESGGVVTAKNAYEKTEFMTSTDERFRPVNAYNGPDGALYVVDMARGIIQHKFFLTYYLIANIKDRNLEVPVNEGRIWRIVPDKVKTKRVVLPKETKDIVAFLDHPNGEIRDTAQRLLVERADASVVDAVKKIVMEGKTPQGRVQALWTLEGLNQLLPDIVTAALHDPNEKVRAAAVRLSNIAVASELLKMTGDKSAEVRLELAAQLSAQSTPEARQAVFALLKAGGSPLLNEAIVSGLRTREIDFLEAILKEPPGKKDDIATSGILASLANCVMNGRRAAAASRLLDLAAAQPKGPRLSSMLSGMAGIPLDKKAKPQQRKLLYLEAQPKALADLAAIVDKDKDAKKLLTSVDKSLAWPGKPGVPPPPVVIPLTAPQQALYDKGKLIFAGLCAACHQPTGTGLDGLAPPLVDSDWVLGPPDRPAKIILSGLSGPVTVGGRIWRLEMPPLPQFSNEDIAGVLTYIRREWEHNASPVSPEDVAKIREANKGRTHAWTSDELKPPAKSDNKKTAKK